MISPPSSPQNGIPANEFPRVLGLWDATCVVVGAIIGVGIFFAPKDVAQVTGSAGAAMLAWTIGGLVALLGAFTFAELGRLRPFAGGQYLVLRDVYGRLPAFPFVFCNLTAAQAGAAAIIAILCAQNLGVLLYGADPGGTWVVATACVLVVVLAAVNVLGVRPGARVQDATVIVKLATLAALVALALAFEPGAAPVGGGAAGGGADGAGTAAAAVPLTFAALFAGVTITLFAYGGGQQILWMAGEVVEARRVVPRAILLGVGIVVVAYLAANWAYLDLLGFARLREAKALAADAFSVASPGFGRRIAAGAVAVSAFGILNAELLSGPRLTWAMAKDGLFFPPFARLHARFATPVPAILLLAGLALALVVGLGLDRTDLLITGVVVVDGVFFVLTGLALPVLRRRAAASERGPAWIVGAAILFSLLQVLAITASVLYEGARIVALTGLAWIAAGALIWALFFRARKPAPAVRS
jgi:APA family basic amino acid/polyamine antiporter